MYYSELLNYLGTMVWSRSMNWVWRAQTEANLRENGDQLLLKWKIYNAVDIEGATEVTRYVGQELGLLHWGFVGWYCSE